MTFPSEYTPEKVAELIGRAEDRVKGHASFVAYMQTGRGKLSELYDEHRALADALTAVSAERDAVIVERDDLEDRLAAYLCDSTGGRLSKTGYDVRTMVQHTEEYYDGLHSEELRRADAWADRLHKAITEALAERMNVEADRILRAALEQKGNDDDR